MTTNRNSVAVKEVTKPKYSAHITNFSTPLLNHPLLTQASQ